MDISGGVRNYAYNSVCLNKKKLTSLTLFFFG